MILRKIVRNIKKGRRYKDINPEDIFIDSTNLPGFEENRFQGRIEKPMGEGTFLLLKIGLVILLLALVSKLWILSIRDGDIYAEISQNNRLEKTLIFANRGVIYDRNMIPLAENAIKDSTEDFAGRLYAPIEGLAHVVGYLKYPLKDKSGIYYDESYKGRDGVERTYEETLKGINGTKLKETDVSGKEISDSVIDEPRDGLPLILSLDAKITEVLHKAIKSLATERGFVGGAAVIMDVTTGEVIAMTSFPEYDQNVLTSGDCRTCINSLINNPSNPFLNRAIGGLYAPGSILKPVVALAALEENLITPSKEILSTGSITVPNPYDATKPSVFGDWKVHGWTNMREAIAVSSDTYFYTIGGGFGDQKGLGITLLDKYFKQFQIDSKTEINLLGEVGGVIPTPEWKKEKFNGEIWRLGDTYITSIGQYGTQITPLNAARFIGAIANRGKILKPSLVKGGEANPIQATLEFEDGNWRVVEEGMRESVTYGTALGLNVSYVKAAAKTGTAEVGSNKRYVHSWSVGFFPFDTPKYAWAVIMEKGPSTNTLGATSVIRTLFDWMSINTPEYFE